MSNLKQLLKEKCSNSVEVIKLADIGKISMCKRILKSETQPEGDIPFYKIGTFGGEPNAYISKETFEKYKKLYSYPQKGDILISAAGTIGRTVIFDGKPAYFQDSNIVWIANDESKVLNKYLYYFYQTNPWNVSNGGTIARLYNDNIAKVKIPVPPLEVQSEIVKILDEYTERVTALQRELEKELTARQKQYEYYRDELLRFGSECEWIKFGDLFAIEMCRRIKREELSSYEEIPFYQNGTLGKTAKLYLSREIYNKYKAISKMPRNGDVMLSTVGTIGRVFRYDGEEAYYQDSNIIWFNNDEKLIKNEFLLCYCRSFPWKVPTRGTLNHLHNYMIEATSIPIPPIKEQERIVSILDRFDKLCNDISEGLPAEIEARRKQYEYYRDKLLSFEEVKT